jgi:hypothetical protein
MNKNFLANLVNYIESTNSLLEKQASAHRAVITQLGYHKAEQQAFVEKVAGVFSELAEENSIPKEYAQEIFDGIKDSPVKMAEFLIKIREETPVKMGAPSNEYNKKSDSFVEFCFGT